VAYDESTADFIDGALAPRQVSNSVGAQFVEPETTPRIERGDQLTQIDIVQTDPQWCRLPPQWWLVEVYAANLQRRSADPPVDKQSVPQWSAIATSPERCVGSAKLVIKEKGDAIRVDIEHGNRFAIFADKVSLQLEVPQPAAVFTDGSDGGAAAGVRGVGPNLLLNNIAVSANIRSNVSPIAGREGKFTHTQVNPGGSNIFIPIPNRAIKVQFYQDTGLGGIPTPMNWVDTDLAGGAGPRDLGQIDWEGLQLTAVRQTGIKEIPGNACFINMGVEARTVTAVFLLEF